MNPIRHIRRIACVLAGLAGGLLAFAAAPAAFARPAPPLTRELPAPLAAHIHQLAPETPGPVPVHTVVMGGMPGWQIALIAIGAALFTAAAAALLARAWTARRRAATAAA
jgi:hypothetical protein